MAEMNQRELRRNNIIVHGLPEPEVSEAGSSKEEIQAKERENLDNLFDSLRMADEVKESVKFRRRIGEKVANKTRPFLIGFQTSNDRDQFMETATKSADKRISFKPDLTKMQREENMKLRNEVQNLNNAKPSDESGDYRWKVAGPPELLRKVKVRDIDKWEEEEARRVQRNQTVERNAEEAEA